MKKQSIIQSFDRTQNRNTKYFLVILALASLFVQARSSSSDSDSEEEKQTEEFYNPKDVLNDTPDFFDLISLADVSEQFLQYMATTEENDIGEEYTVDQMNRFLQIPSQFWTGISSKDRRGRNSPVIKNLLAGGKRYWDQDHPDDHAVYRIKACTERRARKRASVYLVQKCREHRITINDKAKFNEVLRLVKESDVEGVKVHDNIIIANESGVSVAAVVETLNELIEDILEKLRKDSNDFKYQKIRRWRDVELFRCVGPDSALRLCAQGKHGILVDCKDQEGQNNWKIMPFAKESRSFFEKKTKVIIYKH